MNWRLWWLVVIVIASFNAYEQSPFWVWIATGAAWGICVTCKYE